jgi:hypothetical protein
VTASDGVEVRPGSRWGSNVCETQIVIVRAPSGAVDLRCGGQPMVPVDSSPTSAGEPVAGFDEGTAVGKRYADDASGLEVLCTRGGQGSLSIGETRLAVPEPRQLPSSD